ncbi:efflux transporter outer membrane subunit [Novosphingobium sp. 1949]|uniref:Efflux transporter outer membrane subunit n=1 Tax=Novosphingobium organovorum TaxID=2930092 RepID=A0ABT0B8P0_9SPHN|nr:efflux transporter outer membrane subunit [Novosphingobium organovorum]MCJ2181437.1 efflux transporter outer membrane subunit [Novosphingobium organovorum]
MPSLLLLRSAPGLRRTVAAAALLLVGACTMGPDFAKPQVAAPADWSSWRSGDAALHEALPHGAALPESWWTLWGDPVLDGLEARALAANANLASAALHFAEARLERQSAGSALLPQVDAKGSVTRNRLSENGSSTRLFDVIGTSAERDEMAKFLANPFTLFQGGFDAGWEPDLWGKVRRSLEAGDAHVAGEAALLDLTRLSVASEVARAYVALRTVQRQIGYTRQDIAALSEREAIVDARVAGGLEDHTALETEHNQLAALRANLPTLQASEAQWLNALAVLVGDHPGTLQGLLGDAGAALPRTEPDFSPGLPSQVALARPDVRAALAQLHAATAQIGVAQADLYPSIRLGGSFALESYKSENLFDWGSRSWSIGPSLDLPLFDGGRRRAVVKLRKLEQREAAVAFQNTVLKAWQDIDDALNGYAAERQRHAALSARLASAERTLALVEAQNAAGNVNALPVLDAQRGVLAARRDLVACEGDLRTRFIAINKAIGNGPRTDGEPAK